MMQPYIDNLAMKKILIIDDLEDNLLVTKESLEENINNCLVLTAQSGKEGLKIARESQPDTILLDIIMPEMDGYEVCQRLKSDNLTKHIPIIMVTGESTEFKSKITGLQHGANAFFYKPIHIEELVAQIKVAFRIKEAEDELRAEKKLLDAIIKERTSELKKSEENYHTLIDTIDEGIGFVDENETFLFINHASAKIFGYSKEELLGKNLNELMTPKMFERIKNQTLIRKTGKSSRYELTIKRKNGSYRIITVIASPKFDDNGNYKGAFGIFHDITERKHAEKALRESEKRFKLLSNLTFEGIMIHDNGIIKDINQSFTRILGYSRDELIGKNLIEISIPREYHEIIKDTFIKKIAKPYEIIMKKKDGHLFPVEIESRHVSSNEGKIRVAAIRDITKRKQTEAKIKKELMEKELLLNEIHHRVKNNLQVISSLLSLQQNEIKTKQDAIKGFTASQERITAIARAYEIFLSSEYFSEVTSDKYIISLAKQLKGKYDPFNKITLSSSLSKITCDIDKLSKIGLILNELITNALKHAFNEREKGNIYIELKDHKQHMLITIADDGIGLPEDISISNPGTLGLSFVDMLIYEFKGKWSLDRSRGTRFTLKIPK